MPSTWGPGEVNSVGWENKWMQIKLCLSNHKGAGVGGEGKQDNISSFYPRG